MASTAADPLLDLVAGPSQDWALRTVRAFLGGSVSVDQLYRCAFDLLDYRSRSYETVESTERERDLLFQFADALWIMCLTMVLHDDDTELRHYLPQWIRLLKEGVAAFRVAVDTGTDPPFADLD